MTRKSSAPRCPRGSRRLELSCLTTLFLVVSGYWLWLRRRGGLLARLRESLRPRSMRELHRTAGAWSGMLLGMHALTGMVFTGTTGPALQRLATITGSIPAAEAAPVPIDPVPSTAHDPSRWLQALLDRDVQLPLRIRLPRKEEEPLQIAGGDNMRPGTRSSFHAHPVTGVLLAESRWRDFPGFWRVRRGAYALHVEGLLGLPTRLLALVACGGAISLVLTGALLGLRRWRPFRISVPDP